MEEEDITLEFLLNKVLQYLKIVYNNSFHDRYLILDKKDIYRCGASLNYAGSRTFSINNLGDSYVKESLIKELENLLK